MKRVRAGTAIAAARKKTTRFMVAHSAGKRGQSKAAPAQAAGISTQKVAPSPGAEITPISPP